ncbi:RNA polymerase sigma factor [Pusillimonas noertemannii]|uniref:RNA polymerase sigma-70 factor (ECF subfamily) n=1 Tax=Pusillimonas noertemannii TaxID=305977 RepID=A0A2U1CLF1_9BURK|nr:RNA polymerase sigma factor [Pusillimonas noertemannii]NYT69356.1 RNA polymerase sigma factor [Pusillimonas noertemannii]PVY61822.1 RNA polymerase sigma-70 factor (ECF subfamily) [Pusillimonas noertemannii]TFL09753.1 RNA polymerase sigma factor [Pusillimonas noertemannii]
MSHSSVPKKGWLAHYSELVAAWRRNKQADGEDAIQDAVLGMLENGFGAIRDTRGYLARSASNAFVDMYRKRRVLDMRCLEDLGDDEHPRVDDAQSSAYTGELIDALMAALEELPLACQKTYIRHRLEGWTHAEIAADLGVSRSMVEKYMHRALLHIQDRLQKYSPY